MEREERLFRMFGKFFPEGTILFNEKDPGEEMFVIQSGAVRLRWQDGGGRGERSLGPGDILGEEAVLHRSPRGAMAEVVEDSRLLVIDGENLERVIRNGPELSLAIAAELMQRLDEAWDGMRRWQLSYFLGKLEICFRGEAGKALTVEEISARTDIEEGGVRRVLEKLVERGAAAKEGDAFRVSDPAALEAFSRELR